MNKAWYLPSSSVMCKTSIWNILWGHRCEAKWKDQFSRDSESHSVMSNSPGQNTRVGSLSLLQQIFLTQESNWGLLHCRRILHQLSYQGSPNILWRQVIIYGLIGRIQMLGLHQLSEGLRGWWWCWWECLGYCYSWSFLLSGSVLVLTG